MNSLWRLLHRRLSETNPESDAPLVADPDLPAPDESLVNQTVVRAEHLAITLDPPTVPVQLGLQPGHIFEQRFRLLNELGAGGMGQVWLAEQIEPVRRLVALKLIRTGMFDADLVHRFLLERQSIAIMDHPCIAKVFDAGSTRQGQPYFVMEYVPGKQISAYCDEKRLRLVDRLMLFIQVCDGVQHAHQKAIIHRDLKPANILVVEVDGKPVPRIIDFGLAKSAGQPVIEQTSYTRIGGIMGTPGYMSPEQVDPSNQDIDTRTDVYSLGVLLYVLLTGHEPFESRDGGRLRLDEWLRKLREEDPPSLRVNLRATHPRTIAAASARSTEPKQLLKLLHGDLDWITRRALERDREQRYATPRELVADLRRYLDHEPVVAGPTSTAYQLRKFVRRNRVAAAVFAIVTVSAIVSSAAGIIAYNKRNLALMEQASADRTVRFLVSLFKIADPGQNRGNSVTVREMLDRGAADVTQELEHEPVIRADLLTAMGQAYAGLGLYSSANKLLKQAISDQSVAGAPAESQVRTLDASGTALYLAADYDQAQKLLAQAVKIARRELPPQNLLRSETLDDLADVQVQLGNYEEAEKLSREALAVDRKRGPDQAAVLARSLDTLGSVYMSKGDLAAAERAMREALALRKSAFGLRHAMTAQAMNNLAAVLYQSGRYDESEALFKQALPVYREVYGTEHPEVAAVLSNLGRSALMAGHVEDAKQVVQQAVAIFEKSEGPTHDDLVPCLNSLAMIDGFIGNMTDASNEIQRAEQIARLPNQGILLDQVLLNAADSYIRGGRADRAAAPLAEARRLLESRFPLAERAGEAWRYAIWDTVNAELLAYQGDDASARRLIDAARPLIIQRFGPTGFYSLLIERRAKFVEEQSEQAKQISG